MLTLKRGKQTIWHEIKIKPAGIEAIKTGNKLVHQKTVKKYQSRRVRFSQNHKKHQKIIKTPKKINR